MAKKKKKYDWRKGVKSKRRRIRVEEWSLIERTGLMVADVDEFGQIRPSLRSTFRETAKNIRRRI